MLIVVADDDASQRMFTAVVLRNLGHTAVEAENGDVALRLVRETGAPILICDLNMPGLDGHELTKAVRALDLDHYVHIVMVTWRDQVADRRRALEAGVDDFMSKPLDATVLTVRIKAATRLVQHDETLSERNRVLQAAKERIEHDLHAAADAQRRLLPAQSVEIQGCRFTSCFVPSAFVSGDMFGAFPINDHTVAIYSIDVAGHGVHAALLSVAIGHLLSADYLAHYAIGTDGRHDPAALVAKINARFYREDEDDYFTMFCAVLDRRSDTLTYCQAGSPAPFLIAPDGTATVIADSGFPVALLADADFENSTVPFATGSALFVYSDGAIEAENRDGIAFGQDRLLDIVSSAASGSVDILPKRAACTLNAWRGDAGLEDDLTVFTLERIANP